jgi:hypothetical protein
MEYRLGVYIGTDGFQYMAIFRWRYDMNRLETFDVREIFVFSVVAWTK